MENLISTNKVVSDNMIVSIRYKMKNGKGDILEDIMDAVAVNYLHGAGNILPELEHALAGLKKGEQKDIYLKNEQDYAGREDDFYFEVIIDAIRSATAAELKQQGPLPDLDDDCGPDCDC